MADDSRTLGSIEQTGPATPPGVAAANAAAAGGDAEVRRLATL